MLPWTLWNLLQILVRRQAQHLEHMCTLHSPNKYIWKYAASVINIHCILNTFFQYLRLKRLGPNDPILCPRKVAFFRILNIKSGAEVMTIYSAMLRTIYSENCVFKEWRRKTRDCDISSRKAFQTKIFSTSAFRIRSMWLSLIFVYESKLKNFFWLSSFLKVCSHWF